MKTTENISLAGYAFTIETEAYEELGAYLKDIRTCFSSDASADEIVADIEERIAELLRERCIVGMVVDLPMILDIKKRIGDPKELASEDAEASFETKEEAQEQTQQEQPKQEKKAEIAYQSANALRSTGSPLKDMYLCTSGRNASVCRRSITDGCGGRSGLPIANLII